MTTLVTGATGTVGRSLVEQLAQAGEPVRAMTRSPAAARFPSGVQVGHMTGPAVLSVREQVAAIAAAVGGDVRLEEVGREEALRLLQEQGGWAAVNGPFLLGYEGFSADSEKPRYPEAELRPLPTIEQVTGRPARSFADWALDHARDFRSGQPPRRSRRVWTS